ncbi:MAG: hypothetical protein AAF957_08550 [Planctomycetota bacterium]
MPIPSSLKVTLSVTGFYFQRTVDVLPGASVKDVMDQVVAATASEDSIFQYMAEQPNQPDSYLATISIFHAKPVTSRKGEPGKPKRQYPAGLYTFTDGGQTNPAPVWQYYIFDANGGLKSADQIEVPFGQSNAMYPLADGDTIVWRLVGICVGPTATPAKRLCKKMTAQDTTG